MPNFERRFQPVIIVDFSDSKHYDIAKGLYFNFKKVLTQYTKIDAFEKEIFFLQKMLILFTYHD